MLVQVDSFHCRLCGFANSPFLVVCEERPEVVMLPCRRDPPNYLSELCPWRGWFAEWCWSKAGRVAPWASVIIVQKRRAYWAESIDPLNIVCFLFRSVLFWDQLTIWPPWAKPRAGLEGSSMGNFQKNSQDIPSTLKIQASCLPKLLPASLI